MPAATPILIIITRLMPPANLGVSRSNSILSFLKIRPMNIIKIYIPGYTRQPELGNQLKMHTLKFFVKKTIFLFN
jgi:hypothetical protein